MQKKLSHCNNVQWHCKSR